MGFEVPQKVLKLNDNPKKTISEIFEILDEVKVIYFAGGEPLLQIEHYLFLQKLIEHGRTDIQLNYNTNLTKLEFNEHKVLELWAQFKNINVSVSLDGFGVMAEYLRNGLQFSQLESNIATLKANLPQIKISIHLTVSVLNVFHIPKAIGQWLNSGMISKPSQIVLNFVEHPVHYSIGILNESERHELKFGYAEKIATEISGVGNLLRIILRKLDQSDFQDRRTEFKEKTAKLDRLRGEKTSDIIPELKNLLE